MHNRPIASVGSRVSYIGEGQSFPLPFSTLLFPSPISSLLFLSPPVRSLPLPFPRLDATFLLCLGGLGERSSSPAGLVSVSAQPKYAFDAFRAETHL